MSNFSQLVGRWEFLWRKQHVMIWAFGWATLSLLTYVLFSGSAQSTDRPLWYRIFTGYVLQDVALVVAGILCLRNGLSRRMPSGTIVWLLMGIALISYLCGNIFFSSWELVWQLSSTGSLGDPFYVIFYICLALAMILAIVSKQARLQVAHWLIVFGISVYAITIALWVLKPPADSPPVAIVQTQPSAAASASSSSIPVVAPAVEPTTVAPAWVMFFDRLMKPYGQRLNVFYVWCDVALFTLATVMILAFWGGRLSNAWQITTQAVVCYYIADMWFAYAGNHIQDYQGGFMLEVFWILGTIQFGVAAATEFEHMLARQNTSFDES